MSAARRPKLQAAAGLLALIVLAIGLRAVNLGWPPLWADEAESTINALSILGTGLPRDGYLGQPVYENVMMRPWPGNAEYAFRDLSYSDRGLAIYHGWLPLYATALAFRLAGVAPDAARRGPPVRDGSTAEMVRWTVVPRLPALAFSALLVLAAFELGRRTGGSGTAWAMAIACAAGGIFVWLGRQARYYSPTLALSAVCALAVWNACRRGRTRDHVLAGIALALLFHTHALSAVAAALLYVASLPLAPDRHRGALQIGLGGAVAAALVLPWAWWVGLFGLVDRLPPAYRFLDRDLVLHSLPTSDPVVLATALAGAAATAFVLFRSSSPRLGRRVAPLRELGPALYFAAVWTALAWASFVLLIPAPSYFVVRLKLAVAVPGLLLLALLVTAFVHALRPSGHALLVPLAMVVLLVLARQIPPPLQGRDAPLDEYRTAALVRSWPLAAGARVYAMPANQLPLTYYSGRPVQSVSAVRRSWLDGFTGDLVILESRRYEPLPWREVQRIARAAGRQVSEVEAATLAQQAVRRATAEDLSGDGYHVSPPGRAADALERALDAETRRFTGRFIRAALAGTPLGRARSFANWSEFWQFYFFWFYDPARHTGAAVNFRGRALRADTHVVPSGWVVYDCRPRREPPLVPPSD